MIFGFIPSVFPMIPDTWLEPVNPDGGKWMDDWLVWKHGVWASDIPGDEWQMDSRKAHWDSRR